MLEMCIDCDSWTKLAFICTSWFDCYPDFQIVKSVNMPEIQLPDFITNVDWSEKRNKVASVVAGGLFFSGWWFALDASISHHGDTLDVFHLCGVFSTLSMIMVNSVSNSVIRGESFTEGVLGVGGARIWFFVGFLMGFASFIGNNFKKLLNHGCSTTRYLSGSCYILFGEYINNPDNDGFDPNTWYPGFAFFLQNLCILVSSILYKFGRTENMWG